jgi:transcriptional regulator
MKSIAVIIDWENIRKAVFESANKRGLHVNYNEVSNIKKYVTAYIDEECEELFSF